MANELTVSASISYNKSVALIGAVNMVVDVGRALTRQIDIATGRKADVTQLIGTAEEAFSLVDVTNARYFLIQNLDAVNFVQVGTATGVYPIKLFPGDPALFPPNASALFLKSDTAACLVSVTVVNG